jgi:UDP-2-acetamido-2,6-beta-L-arabino-hexul-4-ose reductase
MIEVDVTTTVSDVYNILSKFKKEYIDEHKIPMIWNQFEMDLFVTLRSYMINKGRLKEVKTYTDARGKLSELVIFRSHGQVFHSTTKPGAVRGNHFHTKRIERFCVLSGMAQVNMRRVGTEEIISYTIKGDANRIIDMPPYFTHNLVNIGDTELICCFWMNDILADGPDDSYTEKVEL